MLEDMSPEERDEYKTIARRDYNIDVVRLLTNLKASLFKVKRIGPIAFGYDPADLGIQVDKIRGSLPEDLRNAEKVANSSREIIDNAHSEAQSVGERAKRDADRIIDDAKSQAERILQEAKLQQERMVDESEIVKHAKERAKAIVDEAEEESTHIVKGANHYATQVLGELENATTKILSNIDSGKQALNSQQSALDHKQRQ